MRVEGQGNLYTMDPAASAVIAGTNRVHVETPAGKWELTELDDGSLHVSYKGDLMFLRPSSGRAIVLGGKN